MEVKANRGSGSLPPRTPNPREARNPRTSERDSISVLKIPGQLCAFAESLAPPSGSFLHPRLIPQPQKVKGFETGGRLLNVLIAQPQVICFYGSLCLSLPLSCFYNSINCTKLTEKQMIPFHRNANEFYPIEMQIIIDLWLLTSFSSICKFMSW